MTQVSPEGNSHFPGDTLLFAPPIPRDIPVMKRQLTYAEISQLEHAAVHDEEVLFLGKQAAHLAVTLGVATTAEMQTTQVVRFVDNVERVTPELTETAREALIRELVQNIDARTKTETAAALKSQVIILREKLAAISEKIDDLAPELKKELKPLLSLPNEVIIDTSEFTGEIATPSTAELEASLQNVTAESMSPGRGITLPWRIGRKAVKTFVNIFSAQDGLSTGDPVIDQNIELYR